MKAEVKVGILVAACVAILIVVSLFFGHINPFNQNKIIHLLYNYAGGIEEGSPVRVMGIKVGKVKSIEFKPDQIWENREQVKLRITIEIENKAWETIKEDSKFFINLAGVIGEKFLEITPGTLEQPTLSSGVVLRGEDPPRIDQLISQSYSLAGQIMEIVQKNEGSVTKTIDQLNKLVTNFNKTLTLLEKASQNKDVNRVMTNAVQISDDLAFITQKLRSESSQESFKLLNKLLLRLEPLDAAAIKKFFQEEGVRARVF